MLVISAILLVVRKVRLAFNLGYLSLLLALAVLDMLLFYFEQFSTVLIVGFQFVVILGVIYYRSRYMKISA